MFGRSVPDHRFLCRAEGRRYSKYEHGRHAEVLFDGATRGPIVSECVYRVASMSEGRGAERRLPFDSNCGDTRVRTCKEKRA
jgi:hypothetical protein